MIPATVLPGDLWNPSVALPMLVAAIVGALFAAMLVYSTGGRKSERPERVYPYILGLATGNPPYKVSQKDALSIALKVPGCDSVRGMLERLYNHTRIASRYMAVPDFSPEQCLKGDDLFFPEDNTFQVPVEERLRKFRERAIPLVTDVCRRAIADAGLSPSEISKLVVVSSTGFIGPGLDCEIIESLGLRRDMDRSLIGFMGCAAAMNGFRICNDYVRSRGAGHYALLCCVELSSVHTTFDDDANDAVLHAIFADGCASAVLAGGTKQQLPKGTLAITDDYAWLMQDTQEGIRLSVNANGISCTLARKLPEFIRRGIHDYVTNFLDRNGYKQDDVDFWGVHPGGTRIIEEVQNGLGLTTTQTADSWAVLRDYGNMLSPSIMFVLQRVFKRHHEARERGEDGYKLGLAFSFSPGVGVEGVMLQQVN